MNVLKILIPFSVVAALLACSDDATSNATEDKENLSSLEGVSSADDVSSSSVSDEAVVSSSLELQLSSSSVVPDTARFDADGKIGEFTDSRDGHVYKIVKIGDQVWMAENLNYADSIASPYLKGQSRCYLNDSLNCLKGGRYYTWTAAMDIDSKWQGASSYAVEGLIGNPHRGICPEGWHIPMSEEWSVLENEENSESLISFVIHTSSLKKNLSGFSILLAGFVFHFDEFSIGHGVGVSANFWSASEYDHENAYNWGADEDLFSVNLSELNKKNGRTVRCLCDSSDESVCNNALNVGIN